MIVILQSCGSHSHLSFSSLDMCVYSRREMTVPIIISSTTTATGRAMASILMVAFPVSASGSVRTEKEQMHMRSNV